MCGCSGVGECTCGIGPYCPECGYCDNCGGIKRGAIIQAGENI